MTALAKVLLVIAIVWVLAHAHVDLFYRASLLGFLVFVLGGLVIAGLAMKPKT